MIVKWTWTMRSWSLAIMAGTGAAREASFTLWLSAVVRHVHRLFNGCRSTRSETVSLSLRNYWNYKLQRIVRTPGFWDFKGHLEVEASHASGIRDSLRNAERWNVRELTPQPVLENIVPIKLNDGGATLSNRRPGPRRARRRSPWLSETIMIEWYYYYYYYYYYWY